MDQLAEIWMNVKLDSTSVNIPVLTHKEAIRVRVLKVSNKLVMIAKVS